MSESRAGSVTSRMHRLAAGDADAEHWLMERYFERVCAMARRQLPAGRQRAADEEDVALTVMRNVLRGVRAGTFQRLDTRNDLHQILAVLTRRKTIDFYRRLSVRPENRTGSRSGSDSERDLLSGLLSREIPPELLAEIRDDFRVLLETIDGHGLCLKEIALARLEGRSVNEIAESLDLLPHTVYRRLQLIRERWRERRGRAE